MAWSYCGKIHHEMNEFELWVAFQQGSEEAFARLYQLHSPQLYSYGMKFSADSGMVEDAIHDLFCTLWTSRERLTQPRSVKSYLFKSLRYDLSRKLSRVPMSLQEEVEVLDFHFEQVLDEQFARNEQFLDIKSRVEAALDRLTPRQREVVYYRFYQNMEFDEIADIMNMQVRATYKLTARALDGLRQTLSGSQLVIFLILLGYC